MATKNRHPAPGLIDQARAEPYRFGFFQLVRLLRLHYSRAGRLDPESRPHEDPLRFRSQLSLAFPPSEVSGLSFESDQRRSPLGQRLTQVEITFLGLVGPSGVLPRPYTEMLIDRHVALRDDAAHAFLDIFSHRITAQFYQAWQKYRFFIEYERKGEADFEHHLHALIGVTPTAGRQLFEDDSGGGLRRELFGYFAGLLGQRPRNQSNLEAMLNFYFGVGCRVRPFAGRWLVIDPASQTRLGLTNACLGESALAGGRVWDYQSCMRLCIGPLGVEDYRRFMPGAPDHRRLVELTRFYVSGELDFEVELELIAEQVPAARLGRSGGVALGWLGWLGVAPRTDSGRATFRIPFDGASL